MIEYIVSENIDDRSLSRAAAILNADGIVAFPTDSTWSLGVSIDSPRGIEVLKKLAGKDSPSPLTVICSEIGQISELCEMDTSSFRTVKRLVPGPFVFVLPSTTRAAKDFGLKRTEIGVRIPANPVPRMLVSKLGKPLLCLTAKRTMLGGNEDLDFPEENLFSSGWEIEDIPGVGLVLDPGEEQERKLTTVLDLRAGDVRILRQGIGQFP